MAKSINLTLALFYCRQTPQSSDRDRQLLERKYGSRVRFFPLACSGRIEKEMILRSLEEFADAVYVIACPEGECRYLQGSLRAGKRVKNIKEIITNIGFEGERIGLVMNSGAEKKSLAALTEQIIGNISHLEQLPFSSRHSEAKTAYPIQGHRNNRKTG